MNGESEPADFIGGRTLHHPALTTALERTLSALMLPNVPIVMVVGSAGVGKSHFRRELIQEAATLYGSHDPRYLPAVGMEVKVFSDLKTHWTAFYSDLQTALAHPAPSLRTEKARENIANAVRQRQTRFIVVDEAHHLLFGRDITRRAFAQSEVLKSLTQQMNAKLVLLGTYAMIPLLVTSGQMARRNCVVRFDRYREWDDRTFGRLMRYLDRECRPVLDLSLHERVQFIHGGCLGLMGHLRNWLDDALAHARGHGGSRITPESLAATRASELNLQTLRREAERGEHDLDSLA